MKKLISVSICMAMILSLLFVPSAFAADESVEQAILTAKNLLEISDEKYVIDDFSQNGGEFNLSWKSRDDESYDRISAAVLGGEIVSYHKNYDRNYDRMKFPSVTKDDAQKNAESFIKRVCPSIFETVKINYSGYARYGGGSYTFTYLRYHNDVPVKRQEVYAEVDAENGEVTSFNANYDRELTFESKDGAVGFDKAKDGYIKNFGYELKYVLKYDDTAKKTTAFLAYVPNDVKYGTYLDALTGEKVDVKELIFDTADGMGMKQESASLADKKNGGTGGGAVLSKEEAALNEEIAKLPKQEEVTAKIKAVDEFKIDSSYGVQRYEILKSYTGKYFASVEFSNESAKRGEDYTTKYIRYNLTDNRIESYTSYGESANGGKKADFSKLKESAEKFVNKYYADFASEFEYTKDINSDYRVVFDRVYDGVKVQNNGINLSYDEYTGELTNLYFSRDDAEFAPKDNVKGIDELYGKILTEESLKLEYIVYRRYDDKKAVRGTKLIYALENDYDLYDANTLEKVDYSGEEPVETTYEYDDIENHYVKPYAEKLAQLDIGLEGKSLRPDESITKRDYLMLVALADDYHYEHYTSDLLAKTMIRNGIIESADKNLDEPVSRMDAVRFMINNLGYKEIAAKTSIFNCPFADIGEDMKGYAALGAALGIVSDKSEILDAQNNLTRADALIIIYNYLTRE